MAVADHAMYASIISREMELSARERGTGISRRSPSELISKMLSGHAVIAFAENGEWAGFCYVQPWEGGRLVSNSGLIVAPAFRRSGLATMLKQEAVKLARSKYPDAALFGLTTSAAVMKINSAIGFEPVVYAELPRDPAFWEGCESCVNHAILVSKDHRNCLCTAMMYIPQEQENSYAELSLKAEGWH